MLISEIIISEKTPKQTVEQAAGALKISMGQAWDFRISLGQVISLARDILGKSGDGSGVEPADAVNQAYYQILQKLGPAPTKLPKDADKPKQDQPKKDPEKKEPQQNIPQKIKKSKISSPFSKGAWIPGKDTYGPAIDYITKSAKSGADIADKYTKFTKMAASKTYTKKPLK